MSAQEAASWLVANAQGPKELLRIASNALWLLAMAQIAGADLGRIGLHPPVPWWGTTCLAVLTWWGTVKLSAWQEQRKAEQAPVQ